MVLHEAANNEESMMPELVLMPVTGWQDDRLPEGKFPGPFLFSSDDDEGEEDMDEEEGFDDMDDDFEDEDYEDEDDDYEDEEDDFEDEEDDFDYEEDVDYEDFDE